MRKKIGTGIICFIAALLLATGVHEIFMSTIYDDASNKKLNLEYYTSKMKLENGIAELGLFGALGTDPQVSENTNSFIYRYRYWMIGIGLLMIFGTLWIAALNYLVQTRTKALYEANEQLSHTQSQNKAIINAIPDGIFLLDNDTRVLECKIEGYDALFPNRSRSEERRVGKECR